MSFLFSPKRTVLLIADEALHIYAHSAKGMRLIEVTPWDSPDFVRSVAGVISKECGGRSILILNDMVEQHYRKEKVPRGGVGFFDRATIMNRKLKMAFPAYNIRASLILKEKMKATGRAPLSDIYIFVAVPESEQFRKTMAAARQSLAPLSGFCLLPVESADMVQALSAKLAKGRTKKAQWSVLVAHHKAGGLRQIVTKNGDLALTRMTPLQPDLIGEAWARHVTQEFKATMSYLARFGYQPEDGLDVIAITEPSSGEALETLLQQECTYNTLTTQEAGRLLGLSVAPENALKQYADPLHAAWAARKSSFTLPMKSAVIDQISKPRKASAFISLILLGFAAFLGYQAFTGFQRIVEIESESDGLRSQQSQLDVQYQKELKRKEALGFDVNLIQNSIIVHDTLERERIDVLGILSKTGQALGQDLRFDRITIEKVSPPVQSKSAARAKKGAKNKTPEPKAPDFAVSMHMTYPSTIDIDKGNQEVRDLRDRLQALMPGLKVEVTKFLKDYEYIEELVVQSGNFKDKAVQQDFIAEIRITGGGAP
ncbi:MAG: hypothetical protein K9G62_04085 [Alphaproteobacteria bacterium]|nr:hypothetical protein [Alphaproteobacteria bacterium]